MVSLLDATPPYPSPQPHPIPASLQARALLQANVLAMRVVVLEWSEVQGRGDGVCFIPCLVINGVLFRQCQNVPRRVEPAPELTPSGQKPKPSTPSDKAQCETAQFPPAVLRA